MRHRIKGRKLNRTASHRKALIRNLANQLFEHKEIRTTAAKAKEARITIERLITYAKKGGTHHRRLAFSFLRQKETIKTLKESNNKMDEVVKENTLLKTKIHKMELNERRSNLKMKGFTESFNENKSDCKRRVLNTLNNCGIRIQHMAIEEAYRQGQKSQHQNLRAGLVSCVKRIIK